MSDDVYVVATIKSWNIRMFQERLSGLPGHWHLIESRHDLSMDRIRKINPRYIFFPHWSWIVPPEIVNNYECICFHMTDLPYGRGGSPLQNLILRGHKETRLSALRMQEQLDAGPVYMKKNMSLDGSAEEIYQRASVLSYEMIQEIVRTRPESTPQSGDPVLFRRRTAEESQIPASLVGLSEFYDFVRMLDAEGYPPAFIDFGEFRLYFSGAALKSDQELQVTVKIVKRH